MPVKISRHPISTEIEKQILTAMIVNDQFCTQVHKMIKPAYFQNNYAKIVLGWIQEYFKAYKKAPGKQIQDVYRTEKFDMKDADSQLIGTFLSNLSADYENSQYINYEYLTDQTRDYFRERSLNILSDKVAYELSKGRTDQAEQTVKSFAKVVKETGDWINPFDKVQINEFFTAQEDVLFELPGDLGKMAGPLQRDWLVAFIGPMKRGKSSWLQEFAIQALMWKLKVCFFSLEMNKKEMTKRIYKRITALSDKPGAVSWPTFDCERNQDNTCKRVDRVSSIGVKEVGGELKEYIPIKGYKACSICKELKNGEYRQAVWKVISEQKQVLDAKIVIKKARDFEKIYKGNFKVKSYPAFSATFDDIISDIEDLEYSEGFIPDIICIDSVDIMAPEGGAQLSERGRIDWAWKRAKGLAAQRHCLVATVLQSNRASISQKNVQQENTGEDIRKLAHVDIMFALNQTPEEKINGEMRLSVIAHRHENFTENKEVLVLQSYEIGQTIVDMAWDSREKSKKKGKKND